MKRIILLCLGTRATLLVEAVRTGALLESIELSLPPGTRITYQHAYSTFARSVHDVRAHRFRVWGDRRGTGHWARQWGFDRIGTIDFEQFERDVASLIVLLPNLNNELFWRLSERQPVPNIIAGCPPPSKRPPHPTL